jgi:hypothetical protein
MAIKRSRQAPVDGPSQPSQPLEGVAVPPAEEEVGVPRAEEEVGAVLEEPSAPASPNASSKPAYMPVMKIDALNGVYAVVNNFSSRSYAQHVTIQSGSMPGKVHLYYVLHVCSLF